MNNQISDSRNRILEIVRSSGPISRVEIANQTGLSRSAVTAISQELIVGGFITEVNSTNQQSGRGRPRQGLVLKPNAGYVIGIKLSLHQLSCVIADFSGAPISQATHSFNGNMSPLKSVMLIENVIDDALSKTKISKKKIIRMCVGIPGYISHETGDCYWSPVFDRKNINFVELLNAHFNFDCIIENDANLATLAEYCFGNTNNTDTFCVVSIEHGVGMGLMVDGNLYRGHKGIGPEFGHSKLIVDGRLCRCGQTGCVEAYVADYAILRQIDPFVTIENYNKDPKSYYNKILDAAEKAANGDLNILKAFEEAGAYLGKALGNLIATLNPSTIIITGDSTKRRELFCEAVEREVLSCQFFSDDIDTKIIFRDWGDDVWARGATALALQVTYTEISIQLSGKTKHYHKKSPQISIGVQSHVR